MNKKRWDGALKKETGVRSDQRSQL